MLKQNANKVRTVLMLSDAALVLLSFWTAYQIRLLPGFQSIRLISPIENYLWLAWIAVPLWILLLFSQGLYRSMRTLGYSTILGRIIRVIGTGILILGSLVFLFQAKDFSRSLLGLFTLINFLFLTVFRTSIKSISHYFRKRGYNFRNVALIGLNRKAVNLAEKIRAHPEWSLRILGTILIESDRNPEIVMPDDIPCLGNLDDLPDLLEKHVIDEIIITLEKGDLVRVDYIIQLCEELGIRTHLVADFFNLIIARTQLGYLEQIPLLTFTTTPFREFHLLIKRSIDLLGSSLSLILLAPLLLVICILIRLDSPGPVLFRQIRVGLHGRRFNLLKFRSMVRNAEILKPQMEPLNEMSGPVFKATNDPRVTRVGKFLRRYSLDEIPQLFNVLKGDMSLVGPRPPLPDEVERYKRWHRRRLSMKPGMTCIWQISGRSDIDFEDWMKLDLQYIDHWSLGLDFKILMKTIPAVLSARGAK